MFVKAYKVPGRRLVAIGAACLVVLGFVVYGVGARLAAPRETTQEAGARADRHAAKGKAKTEAERAAFIAQFGWEVTAEPLEITEVVIPEKFDDVYVRYNELQKQQGYDLEKHTGERVKRYTYEVLNYPDTKQEVHLSLMVLDGKVIGGDVSSTALNGFMQGFAKDSAVMSMEDWEPSVEEHSTLAEEEGGTAEAMAGNAAEGAVETAADGTAETMASSIADTMAEELAEMDAELRSESAAPTAAQMPTD